MGFRHQVGIDYTRENQVMHTEKRGMDVEVGSQFESGSYLGLSRVSQLWFSVYTVAFPRLSRFPFCSSFIQCYLRSTKTSLLVSFLTVFTSIPKHSVRHFCLCTLVFIYVPHKLYFLGLHFPVKGDSDLL